MKTAALAAAMGLMGVSALPAAAAKPTNHQSGPNSSHCVYTVAYRVHGTYGPGSNLVKDLGTGTYSGTAIELFETSANRHARTAQSPFTASKTADMTFDITGATVTVSSEVDAAGLTAVAPADRVMVKGTITEQHKSCATGDFTQTLTIKRVVVTPPQQTS
jgi:hypothetical protein